MDYKSDFVTRKSVKDGCAFFSISWSPRAAVNRYVITRSVPARSGLFELFYKDETGKIRLFYMERVWYGGLRSEIRRASDPLEVSDRARRKVLSKYKCYYRYTIVETKEDMLDLMHAYSELMLPDAEPPASSGRYDKVLIGE